MHVFSHSMYPRIFARFIAIVYLQAQLMARFVELENAYHPPTDRGQPEVPQLCAAAEAAAQPGGKLFLTPWREQPATRAF